ncbi:MAG: N-6 DNA methylase [Methanocellales archaeon]|nr:N-6 DNA methylase [Methanocellales archaeon]
MEKGFGEEISLEQLDTNKIANEIREHASESKNEEELKIEVEKLLDPIIKRWNIKASYEHKSRHEISGVRKDALYGTVIIEYKAPGKLESKSEFAKAKEQVKKYIKEEAVDPKYFGRYFGAIIDGYRISFVRFRKNEWEEQEEPLEVNAQTVLRLLEAIRGLRRKPIDAEFLLLDFGPRSEMSKRVILVLYEALKRSKFGRTRMLFDDWKRVFSQVCAYSPEKLAKLIDYYGLEDRKDIDVEKLMFAIHTYYTILMKLLTSEIVTLFADSLLGSYLKRLEEAYYRSHEEMLEELKDLEEGGIFHTVGIRNFLEADYFAWYLEEWDEKIAASIFEITKRLLDYEPATVELNPERVKDLFKRLYQNLVSRDVRHKLGEYYTPDWLAELLLDEVGYDGNPDKRVLDPACGSGTFLVLAIKRTKEYAEEHFLDERELIKKIINNVRGIDLNPLAVLASKANYLIALSDLIRYRPREGIDIPIYLADSISVIRKATLYGDEFELHTNEGRFWITKEVIDKNLLYPVLSLIDGCVKLGYTKEEFEKHLSKKIPLSEESIKSFIRLYNKILKLDKYGKNRIWTSLLKNSFSPMLMGKFDYVIGNPPWINWETLPEFYRNSTKHLWDNYGLLQRTKGMGLGKVKRDLAMLFVARCFSQYVEENGKLAFLAPFTTYKTQAGAGFRSWLANKCEVEKIHDLVELYPFEGAINRTSLLVIKGGQTKFPIPCTMWSNPRSKGMPQEAELEEVKKATKQFDMILAPIRKGKPETSWMITSEKAYDAVQRIMNPSGYSAHAGVYTALNSTYFIDVISKQPNGILIENLKSTGKKKVKGIKTIIKPNLIYPLVRGRDHKPWYVSPSGYILIPTDKKGKTLLHSELKIEHPNTYQYFLNFLKDLVNRGGEPYKTKLKPYRKKPIDVAEKEAPPFYWLFNASPALAPYKVMWKYVAGKISGKGEFSAAVIEPVNDKWLGEKVVIPNEKLMLIPFNEKNEAHFVASVLNSSIAQLIVMSYTIETAISTHVLKNVYVSPFNPKDKIHKKLSELSRKAHELAKKYYEQNDLQAQEELKEVEDEIDKTVAKLYGITDKELNEIKKTLKILKGE